MKDKKLYFWKKFLMSKFIVSARKYRPQTFDSVVGQQHIVRTLKNAIKTGQIAQAYLFCGPRGVGKTTTARIFAKTINCENRTADVEPCNQCASCRAFNEGRSYNIFELDAASNNSVEDIRKLIEQVRIPPQQGRYKVYIIDEVHMLSQAAFNAFLKTLEEPPEHAIFILATTEKHKIIPTILSRCQIFDFNRIKIQDIVDHLKKIAEKEGIKAEPEALNIIAQKADGGLRDALSYFDQIASFSDKNITYQQVLESLNVLDYDYYFKLTDNFLSGNYPDTLVLFDEILRKGFDAHNFILGLAEHFRNLLVLKNPETIELFELGDDIKNKYLQQAKNVSVKFLFKALEIANTADVNYAKSKNKRLLTEIMLLNLSNITQQIEQQSAIVNTTSQTTTSQQNIAAQQTPAKQQQDNGKQQTSVIKSVSIKKAVSNGLANKIAAQQAQQTRKQETSSRPGSGQQAENQNVEAEKFSEVWKKLVERLKKDRPNISGFFERTEIDTSTIAENKITLFVEDEAHKTEMDKHRDGLKKYFKKEMNKDFDFVTEIKKKSAPDQQNMTFNTAQEKYNYLKQINPKIDDLRNTLGLTL